jgi:hypothetical protein
MEKPMTTPSLEEKIAAALTKDDLHSADLAALLDEVEEGIHAADEDAEEARARALDPTVLDPGARAAMQDAEFLSKRLQVALPQLQERLQEVEAEEYRARWEPEFEQIEAKRDELANKLAVVYPKCVEELCNLFIEIQKCDYEVARINRTAPRGESRRLDGVERASLGDERSILERLKLPHWASGQPDLWPPPTPVVLPQLPANLLWHPGADWNDEQYRAQHAAERLREAEMVGDYNAEQARLREERKNDEARQRADEERERRSRRAR